MFRWVISNPSAFHWALLHDNTRTTKTSEIKNVFLLLQIIGQYCFNSKSVPIDLPSCLWCTPNSQHTVTLWIPDKSGIQIIETCPDVWGSGFGWWSEYRTHFVQFSDALWPTIQIWDKMCLVFRHPMVTWLGGPFKNRTSPVFGWIRISGGQYSDGYTWYTVSV